MSRETLILGCLEVVVTTAEVSTGGYVGTYVVLEGHHLIGSGCEVAPTEREAHTRACHLGDALAVGVNEAIARAVERRDRDDVDAMIGRQLRRLAPGGFEG